MRFALSIPLLAALIALPSIAEAAPRRRYYYRPYEPTHQGLMLRLDGGVGAVVADDDLNAVTLSGGGLLFSVDLGGAVAPDLALHGRLSFNSMFEPTVSSGPDDLGDLEDTSLTFTLLGLGLTYYFPSNLYLTGVLGVSRASFKYRGDEYDALTGVGFQGDLGYEWPIGGKWGLGVAGRLELETVRGDDERLSVGTLGVLLSVTCF
ncbi:MAG TPA: hypothetical protein VFS67_32265 [Polyangiaceae bacterium]|jgi:hypothetical protein|nr:hypothetical protein [Polyangiaceae bacterium]